MLTSMNGHILGSLITKPILWHAMLVDLNPKIGSKFGMIFLIEQNKFKIDSTEIKKIQAEVTHKTNCYFFLQLCMNIKKAPSNFAFQAC